MLSSPSKAALKLKKLDSVSCRSTLEFENLIQMSEAQALTTLELLSFLTSGLVYLCTLQIALAHGAHAQAGHAPACRPSRDVLR